MIDDLAFRDTLKSLIMMFMATSSLSQYSTSSGELIRLIMYLLFILLKISHHDMGARFLLTGRPWLPLGVLMQKTRLFFATSNQSHDGAPYVRKSDHRWALMA
jgi:hypothetical protein